MKISRRKRKISKKKINIAIDLDGTIVDNAEIIYGNMLDLQKKYGIVSSKLYEDMEKSLVTDHFSELWSVENLKKQTNCLPKENAVEVIKKWKRKYKNVNLFIITGRYNEKNYNIEEDTYNWLKKYFGKPKKYFSDIVFDAGNKDEACISHEIDILIDDNKKVLEIASVNGRKCVQVLTPFEKGRESINACVLDNWKAVDETVRKYIKNTYK